MSDPVSRWSSGGLQAIRDRSLFRRCCNPNQKTNPIRLPNRQYPRNHRGNAVGHTRYYV